MSIDQCTRDTGRSNRATACFSFEKGLTRTGRIGADGPRMLGDPGRTHRGVAAMSAYLTIVAALMLASDDAAQATSDGGKRASAPTSTASASGRNAGVILANQCVSCHGPEKKKRGLDLSRRASALTGGENGPVIVPGRPGESLLVEKVSEGEMPPKGALSKDEIAAVRPGSRPVRRIRPSPCPPARAGRTGGRYGPSSESSRPGCAGPPRPGSALRSMSLSSPGSRRPGSGRRRRPTAPP